MQTLKNNTKNILIFLNLSTFVPSVPWMKMLLLTIFVSCHCPCQKGNQCFSWHFGKTSLKSSFNIHSQYSVVGLDIIECLCFPLLRSSPPGAVWHRSEDSFWICLCLSIFLLSSITLSLPPSSSPNRCRLVLIDEANALQERLVLSPHAAKGVSCVLTLESRS